MTAPLCLLTRSLAQSQAFAAELPSVECLIAPILRIEALAFDAARVAAAPGLIFTSANAVPFAGAARGRPALVVGPQTALAARAAGFVVQEGPGDALGMLPLLAGREGWLHLHGRHRARALPVEGIAVYDQIAQPLSAAAQAALAGARRLILPLFSPRSAALLSDATNVEEAYKFLDFIMLPENAALISAFARYANGISGSEEFMPADMKDAPEINIPEEFKAAGRFLPTCTGKGQEYITAIWTELQK